MTGQLQKEIKQSKPFVNPESEAFLNLIVLVQELSTDVNALLKAADLSGPQYNVLRILRGAGDEGLACREIGERMIHRIPDVTRLLDRLETRKLVKRERESADRRVVRVRITPEGLGLLAPLDTPLAKLHKQQLGGLGPKKVQQFIRLLEEARRAHRAAKQAGGS